MGYYLVTFLVPAALGAIFWVVERGRRVSADSKAKDKARELEAALKKLGDTEAALTHTNDELAYARTLWDKDLAAWAKVDAQKVAQIEKLEAELARVLDPRVVGEHARRMLSEGAGGPAPGESTPGAFGAVPFGRTSG